MTKECNMGREKSREKGMKKTTKFALSGNRKEMPGENL
jgi:hypothetical protein